MATIPKEMQTAYQRWEMNSFDPRPAATPAAAQPETVSIDPAYALPTVEELAEIREQARAEGYDEGHAAGYADALAIGRAEAATELEHVKALALTFGTALSQADENIAADVLELALHLAKGMLRTALEVKPELVIPVVREAIEYLPVLQQPAILMLNPDDIGLVRDAIGEELDKGGWRVVEDAQIARGGCKIDTASNQIDAQAASRWQRLSQSLGKNVEWLA
ncbi:flagellar assembly protein FliH [Massilia sp. GCM10020059]|uniref:Flagellar assembly protein FliH n=1 Tax=Massilia agrisoli TaxID=2892444 RepID=A0ABS8IU02_9BURK|nr:flagellar assembly protein FliH [Massilia agrisoli]MCC6071328.1 flagellar assembly protein FliH [Massilia agrisoli]